MEAISAGDFFVALGGAYQTEGVVIDPALPFKVNRGEGDIFLQVCQMLVQYGEPVVYIASHSLVQNIMQQVLGELVKMLVEMVETGIFPLPPIFLLGQEVFSQLFLGFIFQPPLAIEFQVFILSLKGICFALPDMKRVEEKVVRVMAVHGLAAEGTKVVKLLYETVIRDT